MIQPVFAGDEISRERANEIANDTDRGEKCPECQFRKWQHPGYGGFYGSFFNPPCWVALFIVNCEYFIEQAKRAT